METLTVLKKALQYKNEYGIDGIMIGRAAIGYLGF
jgi:tRNA-dihydrouridine synthase